MASDFVERIVDHKKAFGNFFEIYSKNNKLTLDESIAVTESVLNEVRLLFAFREGDKFREQLKAKEVEKNEAEGTNTTEQDPKIIPIETRGTKEET